MSDPEPEPRDLLVTTHTPALGSGQAMRTYGLARALAAHRRLDILYARFGAGEPDEAFSSIARAELHAVVPSRGAARLAAYARARLAGVPGGFARGASPELAREASRLAGLPGRERVIADGPIAMAALWKLAGRRAVIYNAHNFESELRPQYSAHGDRELRALRAFERGLLEAALESWMVSDSDIASARELFPGARLRYVPNVVDVAAIAPVQPALASRRALFVASFGYEPNRNGLDFLLEQVFPLVWRELPEATLALVGRGLEQPPSSDSRVETLGFVDDIADAYADASCALVPLLQGSGSPLKFVEALAYGLPVIATPRAAAGLEVRDGEHCLIAADGPSFAQAVVQVLRDGAPEIARRGRELAAARYSIEALSSLLAPDANPSPPSSADH